MVVGDVKLAQRTRGRSLESDQALTGDDSAGLHSVDYCLTAYCLEVHPQLRGICSERQETGGPTCLFGPSRPHAAYEGQFLSGELNYHVLDIYSPVQSSDFLAANPRYGKPRSQDPIMRYLFLSRALLTEQPEKLPSLALLRTTQIWNSGHVQ